MGIDNARTELILRRMSKEYLPYDIDQRLLMPPDMRDWLPEGHLALFILDVVAALDLSKIHGVYEARDDRRTASGPSTSIRPRVSSRARRPATSSPPTPPPTAMSRGSPSHPTIRRS